MKHRFMILALLVLPAFSLLFPKTKILRYQESQILQLHPRSEERGRLIDDHKIKAPALMNKFTFHTHINSNGESMPFRLFTPETLEPDRKYPLVVFLHGSSGSGKDNKKQLLGANMFGGLVWVLPENQKRYPCFVIAPQSDVNWPCVILKEGQLPDLCPWPAMGMGARLAFEIIDNLVAEKPIDLGKVYITGQSMGGAGVWHMIAHRPYFFAAAVPVCGRPDPLTASLIEDMPIWNFHGETDKVEPVKTSRHMIKALNKAGGKPWHTEYKGVGHNVFMWAYTEPSLIDWIFTQSRPTADFPSLIRSIQTGDMKAVRDWIEKDPLMVNARERNGRTPLHYIALGGGEAEVNLILKKGADINARDFRGQTPLFMTIPFVNTETFEALVRNGADLNTPDLHTMTPLHLAAFYGQINTIRFLLDRGASINALTAAGQTPLILARYRENRDAEKLLIAQGARTGKADFPAILDLYFHQKKPGLKPELFAPGIISTEEHEGGLSFSPDKQRLVFSRMNSEQNRSQLMEMVLKNKTWSEPRSVSFNAGSMNQMPFFSPDGSLLYFISNRPLDASQAKRRDNNIWRIGLHDTGWGKSESLSPEINSPDNELYATVDRSGRLAFHRRGLNLSLTKEGKFMMGKKIEIKGANVYFTSQRHPFISPDGSYIIFDAHVEGKKTGSRLYITFLKSGGTWSKALLLLEECNSSYYDELAPSLSPDNKYLFFQRSGDIYWVDANVISNAKTRLNLE